MARIEDGERKWWRRRDETRERGGVVSEIHGRAAVCRAGWWVFLWGLQAPADCSGLSRRCIKTNKQTAKQSATVSSLARVQRPGEAPVPAGGGGTEKHSQTNTQSARETEDISAYRWTPVVAATTHARGSSALVPLSLVSRAFTLAVARTADTDTMRTVGEVYATKQLLLLLMLLLLMLLLLMLLPDSMAFLAISSR